MKSKLLDTDMTDQTPALTEADRAEIATTVKDAMMLAIRADISIPDRTHVPELERIAWNQMPKVGVRDLRLMRYDGTNLYAWYGKNGVDTNSLNWSVFDDAQTEPFRIVIRD